MRQPSLQMLRDRFQRSLSVWIPVVYALFLFWVSPIHSIFDEWGGTMQYFAGREILLGVGYRGWTAGFWPPLYSLLVGVGSHFAPGFVVGKAISMVAAVALLWLTYHLAMELSHRRSIAFFSQLFLVLTPFYGYESLQAHNHMLDALLFVGGLFLFLRALRMPSAGRWFATGLVCGLASLTRYTSNTLVLLPVSFLVLGLGMRRAARWTVLYLLGFLVVAAPWWVLNARWNGSPFHTLEYLNTCAGIFRDQWHTHNLAMLWHANAVLPFENIWEVFAAFPHRYLYNVELNVLRSIPLLMKSAGVLGPFAIPAFLYSVFALRNRRWVVICGLLSVYVLAASQAFEPDYVFLGWTVLSVILSLMLIQYLLERIQGNNAVLRAWCFPGVFLIVMAIIGYQATHFTIEDYAPEELRNPLTKAPEVVAALRHDPELSNKVIMASDPGWAYYAGSKYLETPPEYEGPVEGLVRYRGLDERVRAYAPKVPSTMPLDRLHADYLIFTRTAPDTPYWYLREPSGYAFLLDPGSKEIPRDFELVYRSKEVVAYRIGNSHESR